MIHLAFVTSNLMRSGPYNVLYNIVKYLDHSIFKISIISLSPEPQFSRVEEFRQLGCSIHNFGFSRVQGLFKNFHMLKKWIKENKPDILHGHGIRPDHLISRLHHPNRFSTIHSYIYHDYVFLFGKVMGTWLAFMHLNFLKSIPFPIACSVSVASYYEINHGFHMNHIRNGVDTSLFCKIDNEEKYRKRIKLNLPIYKKIFVSVGLLNRRKNPLRIIDCFNQIHRNDAILVFLGSGELENSCRDFASSSNHIFTRGFSRSVLDYLQASDFFISASLLEGMPNAVMEALATGLPCVLSDIPPHHELWELNPDVVHLFNPNSTSSLVDAVFAILSKNHNTLSNEAVKLAKGSLDATIMVRAYENRYIQRYNETSL